MVVIALPLWLHAPVAIEAMKAGKHVFCEKLMAHSVGECKEMVRVAHETNRLLAIGHQRHYSALYDNANYLVQNGHLGEIRHIRALWHRNKATPDARQGQGRQVPLRRERRPRLRPATRPGTSSTTTRWKPPIPTDDTNVDFKKYGYKSLEELVRWRLYNRTGAGLMAELGSHQLDACSIFLGKEHPLAVTGIGGRSSTPTAARSTTTSSSPSSSPARTARRTRTTSSSPTRRSTPTRSRSTARRSWAPAGR